MISIHNERKFISFQSIMRGNLFISKLQLDVDPRMDDDESPMSSYKCMLRTT